MGYVDLLSRWACVVLNAALWLLDLASDACFGVTTQGGTAKERREAAAAGYPRSAHLVDVRLKGGSPPFFQHSLARYLCTHRAYVHPREALRTNACLYFVDGDSAVFAVADDRSKDFYNTERIPFLFFALEALTTKFIVMPVESLHKLAEEEVGDPKAKVI